MKNNNIPKLILFIKSYKPDFERAENLLKSIEKYNGDNIPVYMSVNDEDFEFFKHNISSAIHLIKDSDITTCHLSNGWKYQQIIKSQVHKLNICENYVCIDSDSEFIRDFYTTDFMYDDSTPYTIMHEHKYILNVMEIIGHDSMNSYHINALKALRTLWGIKNGKNWDYGPSPYIWSTKVWQHLEDNYLAPNGHTFESFFVELEEKSKFNASETIIYGEYLRKEKIIDIIPVEGLFKAYFWKEHFDLEKKHHAIEKLKKNYMGIIMQSTWYDYKKHKQSFLGNIYTRKRQLR